MQTPFFQACSEAQTILIAGAGGGFDVVSGIPLYLYFRSQGKQVVLANLSFTALPFADCEEVFPGTYRVTDTAAELPYFPERYILEWLRERGEAPSVYALSNQLGVQPLRAAYAHLLERHQVDTLVLVDGGTDSLMFGDEAKVGTIVEDACSIVAAARLPVPRRYLAAIGFGVEHQLNHHACLENIADLIKGDQYLGAQALTPALPEGRAFVELVEHLNQRMALHRSIVTNSIASAIQGEFGDIHFSARTQGSVQFVNPLMGLYWYFQLEGVATRIRFADEIERSTSMREVADVFQRYRILNSRRLPKAIPLA
ncbi:MAG: DUF1152 domain-containing protein [Inhella sp.]